MPKRAQEWQQRRAATAKAMRAREPCDTPGCKNLGMGWYAIYTPRSLWLCVDCAAREQRERRTQT